MISSSESILESSLKPQHDSYIFSDKTFLTVPDQQNGMYPTGQITFDSAQLINSGRYLGLKEAFLEIPLVAVVVPTSGALTASVENDFAFSLKNGHHQLINSISVKVPGVDICTTTNYTNIVANYKILSTWSSDTVKTYGPSAGFFGKDDCLSDTYYGGSAGNAVGVGLCNNSITPATTTGFTPYTGNGGWDSGNSGRLARMSANTSFDPANTTNDPVSGFISAATCNTIGKSYVSNSTGTTYIQFNILATVPLSILHDFFCKMPLVKNVGIQMTINTNCNFQVACTLTAGASPVYTGYTNLSTGNGLTCPFMLSPLSPVVSSATVARGLCVSNTCASLIVGMGIGSVTVSGSTYKTPFFSGCRLIIPAYTMTPSLEEKYLSSMPMKRIMYEDINFYSQSLTNIPAGNSFRTLLTSGIKRPKWVLIVPQIAASLHGSAIAGLQSGSYVAGVGSLGSPLMSPFSSCPATCCPYARVSNLQVWVASRPVYESALMYGYEQYFTEIRKRGAYGNQVREIASGLISEADWATNYGYIFVNLQDKIESEVSDKASQALEVGLTNSSAITMDYLVFVGFEKLVDVTIGSGAFVPVPDI